MSALTRWTLYERRQHRRKHTIAVAWTGALTLILTAWFAFAACAHFSDTAAVYTEGSIRAAEQKWDDHYNAVADQCEAKHEARTPGMEACLGDTYDANAKVGIAIRSAVALLRSYWTARSQGQQMDWRTLQIEIDQIFLDLPPEAKEIFAKYARVKQ